MKIPVAASDGLQKWSCGGAQL